MNYKKEGKSAVYQADVLDPCACFGRHPTHKPPTFLRYKKDLIKDSRLSLIRSMVQFLIAIEWLVCPIFRVACRGIGTGEPMKNELSLCRVLMVVLIGKPEPLWRVLFGMLLFGAIAALVWGYTAVRLFPSRIKIAIGQNLEQLALRYKQIRKAEKPSLETKKQWFVLAVFLCEVAMMGICFGYGLTNCPVLYGDWIISYVWVSPLIWVIILMLAISLLLRHYERKVAEQLSQHICMT